MGLIINKTDFVGKYYVPQNRMTDTIDSYIAKYEERHLIDLLGVELFKLFKANYSPGPVSGVYKSIFDPIQEDDGGCVRISEGMKEMLLAFVYFDYWRDQKLKNTISGTKVDVGENTREAGYQEQGIYFLYNDLIESYKTIQWFINENISDYPDFNGQSRDVLFW